MKRLDSQIITDETLRRIHGLLREIEQRRNLRIVFACESGSRAWGFASSDSDFDVRFIFARPTAEYLRLRPPADAFDLPADGDIDAAGWDIRKTAELMSRSNPPLLEWLDSPIIYRADDFAFERLRKLRDHYFDPKKSAFHYLNLARGVWHKYIEGNSRPVRKKYLYVLRPLACIRYIELHRRQPPTEFENVLSGIDWPERAMASVRHLVEQKKAAAELGMAASDPVLDQYIVAWLNQAERLAQSLPPQQRDLRLLDELIEQVIRPTPPPSRVP